MSEKSYKLTEEIKRSAVRVTSSVDSLVRKPPDSKDKETKGRRITLRRQEHLHKQDMNRQWRRTRSSGQYRNRSWDLDTGHRAADSLQSKEAYWSKSYRGV